ncbi:hypothetical protein QAD02_016770 [Eretmocerus hayati]|uniref:Uncharacterized protein n=1 Tax=Eretmocerus hayati TaxID=131215 RepID=A0ACC2PD32_9HYME|nr:hypothetical protein QAD02_016770 [Eretmocerus hayati]
MKCLHQTVVVLLVLLASSQASWDNNFDCWGLNLVLSGFHGTRLPLDYCITKNLNLYKLHENLTTWNEARKICLAEGAHLAVINSKEEADLLSALFKNSQLMNRRNHANKGMFVGFHDLFQEREFVTVLDEPLDKTGYNTWTREWGGQPDNGKQPRRSEKSQDCGALSHDGGLDDVGCSWKLGFICEIPIEPRSRLALTRNFIFRGNRFML